MTTTDTPKRSDVFKQYRRSQIAELRPYILGEDLNYFSLSREDEAAGSPKPGDMIARNPKNHKDQWLVAAKYFADNFEPIDPAPPSQGKVERAREIAYGKVRAVLWEALQFRYREKDGLASKTLADLVMQQVDSVITQALTESSGQGTDDRAPPHTRERGDEAV